jgi:hypothetical protein
LVSSDKVLVNGFIRLDPDSKGCRVVTPFLAEAFDQSGERLFLPDKDALQATQAIVLEDRECAKTGRRSFPLFRGAKYDLKKGGFDASTIIIREVKPHLATVSRIPQRDTLTLTHKFIQKNCEPLEDSFERDLAVYDMRIHDRRRNHLPLKECVAMEGLKVFEDRLPFDEVWHSTEHLLLEMVETKTQAKWFALQNQYDGILEDAGWTADEVDCVLETRAKVTVIK